MHPQPLFIATKDVELLEVKEEESKERLWRRQRVEIGGGGRRGGEGFGQMRRR